MKTGTIVKKAISVILMLTLVLTFSFVSFDQDMAYAAEDTGLCGVVLGDNDGDQNYWRWAEPIRSYLIKEGSQLMRVQASEEDTGKFQVTYYDPSTYMAVSRKTIYTDLPLFGGFATDGYYYYVVTGQNNTERSDNVEVFRVQQFDKNWNSLGYDSLYGANTMYPFDAGCCRFAFSGNYMVVRTAHEMYSGHQANVTILFNTSSCAITDSQYDVSNIGRGYVSHSFNQFVVINNDKIVALDHGDAYPRAFVLCEYPTNISSGKFNSNSVTSTNILDFEGASGDNETGATVGAFEMNSYNYIMAYSTVQRDSNFANYDTHNVFVDSIDKNSKSIRREQFTNISEGEGDASTPHLVNIGGAYLVLWNEANLIYCNKVTAKGVKVDDANTLLGYGYLSDCVPLYDSDNYKVIWYNYDDGEEEFYEIDLDSMTMNSYEHRYEHNHVYDSTSGGYATMKCTECGNTYQMVTPVDFTAQWRGNNSVYSEEMPKISYATTLYYDFIVSYPDYDYNIGRLSDMVIEPNDSVNSHVDQDNKAITFDKAGTYSFTAYPKYNPSVKKTYNVTVGTPLSKVTISADKTTIQPNETINLSAVSEGGSEIVYSFHAYTNSYGYESYYDTIRSADSPGTCAWTPAYTGTYIVKVLAQDVGGDWTEAEDKIYITVRYNTEETETETEDEESGGGYEPDVEEEVPEEYLNISGTVSKISNRTYTGKTIKPKPTVKFSGVKLINGQHFTYKYKNCKNVGLAKVIITGKGDFTGTLTKTFKILPKGTKLGKLTSKTKSIKVKWIKRSTKMSKSRITGYQIQYAKNSKFKSAKKIKVKGYKKTTTTIKNLKRKTTYYVRIRTYMKVGNKTYYSKWSKSKKIKTK